MEREYSDKSLLRGGRILRLHHKANQNLVTANLENGGSIRIPFKRRVHVLLCKQFGRLRSEFF
ncbi:MAG: hypothetical protein EBS84_10430 [Proteobacteria bacterium]|nr:hypothetical protein [Verrucomicrobiota bacterium]NBU09419.1 hypothetical protein [Pseudomonadota bacterium]